VHAAVKGVELVQAAARGHGLFYTRMSAVFLFTFDPDIQHDLRQIYPSISQVVTQPYVMLVGSFLLESGLVCRDLLADSHDKPPAG